MSLLEMHISDPSTQKVLMTLGIQYTEVLCLAIVFKPKIVFVGDLKKTRAF